jgi:hypothetical protein
MHATVSNTNNINSTNHGGCNELQLLHRKALHFNGPSTMTRVELRHDSQEAQVCEAAVRRRDGAARACQVASVPDNTATTDGNQQQMLQLQPTQQHRETVTVGDRRRGTRTVLTRKNVETCSQRARQRRRHMHRPEKTTTTTQRCAITHKSIRSSDPSKLGNVPMKLLPPKRLPPPHSRGARSSSKVTYPHC